MLQLYADRELGAYGYDEKPWYLPHARLEGFLAELKRRGHDKRVAFRSAGPATDEDLMLFHSRAHLDDVRRRCEANEGSLDVIDPRIVEDARALLEAVSNHPGALAAQVRPRVEPTFTPSMTFEGYLGYMASCGLMTHDAATDVLRLTPAGVEWLADDQRRLSGPTFARKHIEPAATWVAGAAIDATRRIVAGEFKKAFVPIAGFHHAHREEARLYCLYNDPALALATALQTLDGTLAYVDIDIHHGDGVYEGFAAEPRVVIADLHEDPSTLFPYTPEARGQGEFWGRRSASGRGAAVGTKLNIPLAPNTTDDAYLALWVEAEAHIRAARPQFIVFESGVDGLHNDPTSNQLITERAIREVTRSVRAVADELAEGRLLVLGGGGYDPAGVGSAWCAVVEALLSG